MQEKKKNLQNQPQTIKKMAIVTGISIITLNVNGLNAPTSALQGPQKKEKKKGAEKVFEEITVENFPNMGKEIVNQVQEVQSPIQDKPKDKHVKTHTNQANRD